MKSLVSLIKWLHEDERYIAAIAYLLAGLSAKITYEIVAPAFGKELAYAGVIAALLSPWAWKRVVVHVRQFGWTPAITPVLALGVLVTGTDLFSNFQGVGTKRTVEITRVNHTNTTREHAQSIIGDSKELRDKLMADRARLLGENPWLSSVTTDGLVAQLTSLKAQRFSGCGPGTKGAGRGSCWTYTQQCAVTDGPATSRFCGQVADLKDRIAGAKKFNAIDTRVAAIDHVLLTKTETVAETPEETSVARVQAANIAWFFDGFNLNPSDETLVTTDKGISAYYALFLTFAAMLVMIVYEGTRLTGRRLGPGDTFDTLEVRHTTRGQMAIDALRDATGLATA